MRPPQTLKLNAALEEDSQADKRGDGANHNQARHRSRAI